MLFEFEEKIFFYSQCRYRILRFINKTIRSSNLCYIHEKYQSAILIRCEKLNKINQFKQRQNRCR